MTMGELIPLRLPPGVQLGPNEWDGIPHLGQVLRQGGWPGVEYVWVAGDRLGHFQKLDWSEIVGLPAMTIHGPKGVCDSIKLLGLGDPIPGAEPLSGLRWGYIDIPLSALLGYEDQFKMTNLPVEKVRRETQKTKARAAGESDGPAAA